MFEINLDEFGSILNKKVLLHEHKRHTACQVTSACSAALSSEGGTPIQFQWGYLHPVPMGVPPSSPIGGVPHPVQMVVPPFSPDWGYPMVPPPIGQMGYPPFRKDGVPPSSQWCTPSPPPLAGWGTLRVLKDRFL